jgi:hypothetical protein
MLTELRVLLVCCNRGHCIRYVGNCVAALFTAAAQQLICAPALHACGSKYMAALLSEYPCGNYIAVALTGAVRRAVMIVVQQC